MIGEARCWLCLKRYRVKQSVELRINVVWIVKIYHHDDLTERRMRDLGNAPR